jgi:hypothetical protein
MGCDIEDKPPVHQSAGVQEQSKRGTVEVKYYMYSLKTSLDPGQSKKGSRPGLLHTMEEDYCMD